MTTNNHELPLRHILGDSIGPLFTMGWEAGIEAQRDADQLVLNGVVAELAASEVRGRRLAGAARVALKYFQQMQHLIPQAPMGFFSEREPIAICSQLEVALAEWKKSDAEFMRREFGLPYTEN